MGYHTPEQRYEMLMTMKNGGLSHLLTEENHQFIKYYAKQKVTEMLRDPEFKAAADEIYEQLWAHRIG